MPPRDGRPFLPYARQRIDQDDIDAVIAVLQGEYLTCGPEVDAFEQALSSVTGTAYSVACNSGTAALHMAMAALGIGPGDAVIVPTVTFLATANAVKFCGGDVIFCDVDPETGLMTPETLTQTLKSVEAGRVKAAIPVHMGGQLCDMAELASIAERFGLDLVEDACHALGGFHDPNRNEPVGGCAHSKMAAFSFHPAKTVAMGEGGAVTTNDAALDARLRLARNHGMQRDPQHFVTQGHENEPWYYEMVEPAPNYRASDLACALGRSQLKKLDTFVDRRRALVERYDALINDALGPVRPVRRIPGQTPAWHLYQVFIDFDELGIGRETVMRRLADAGIGTQVHYIPVHSQPYYRGTLPKGQAFPGAQQFYDRVLALPLFAAMSDADPERVVSTLAQVIGT